MRPIILTTRSLNCSPVAKLFFIAEQFIESPLQHINFQIFRDNDVA